MCLGIPGKVIEMVDPTEQLAKVDVGGVQRSISVQLLADTGLHRGDWVLVHVGFALARIDEAEAQATLDQLRRIGADYIGEIEAFATSDITPSNSHARQHNGKS